MTVPDAGTSEKHFTRGRVIAIAFLLFLLWFSYRVFAVYTVRTGECATFDSNRPPLDWTGVRKVGEQVRKFPPREASESKRLLVLSYNIEGHASLWRSEHISHIGEVIRSVKPDLVGLQEVHRGTWQSRNRDQIAELARLTGMKSYFGKSFDAMGGEFGNAVLTRGTILDAAVLPLPSVGEPRSLTRTTVEIEGRRFNFFVTHLAAWGKLHRKARSEEISCLREHLSRSDLPFILVGDLNAGPDAPEIRELIESPLLQICGGDIGDTHPLTHQRLDYVFSDYGWGVRNVSALKQGPSDHWPLQAELEWEASATAQQ